MYAKLSFLAVVFCLLSLMPFASANAAETIVKMERDPELPSNLLDAPRYKGGSMIVGDEVKTNGMWVCPDYEVTKFIARAYRRGFIFGRNLRVHLSEDEGAPCWRIPASTFTVLRRYESIQGIDNLGLPILQTIVLVRISDGTSVTCVFTTVLNKVLPLTFWG